MGSSVCRGGWPAAGVLYRVDPRLFRDDDGDGVGDLAGLTAELDYLRWLGVDAVWPVFDAIPPDAAWDGLLPVARPEGVHLADGRGWRTLTAAAHRRGLRVVIDGWAEACRVCRDGGRALADDPAARRPGGSTGAVRTDLSLRTAFANGIDAVWAGDGWAVPAAANEGAAAGPGGGAVVAQTTAATVPATLRALLPAPPLPNAGFGTNAAMERRRPGLEVPGYASEVPSGLNTAVAASFGKPPPGASGSPVLTLVAAGLLAAAAAPPSERPTIWTMLPGSAPRLAGAVGTPSAAALALLLLCLPGVVAVASGDELGLVDGPPAGPADPATGRPPCGPERAAMAWDEGKGAGGGFAAWPWRPLAPPTAAAVSRQRTDPDSLLALHRRAIALRRGAPALTGDDLLPVAAGDGLLAVLREDRNTRFLVALNLGGETAAAIIGSPTQGHVALATRRQREGERARREVRLDPGEAVVVRLDR